MSFEEVMEMSGFLIWLDGITPSIHHKIKWDQRLMAWFSVHFCENISVLYGKAIISMPLPLQSNVVSKWSFSLQKVLPSHPQHCFVGGRGRQSMQSQNFCEGLMVSESSKLSQYFLNVQNGLPKAGPSRGGVTRVVTRGPGALRGPVENKVCIFGYDLF